MLRLLNFSFKGDIHWVFFIINIKVGNRTMFVDIAGTTVPNLIYV